MKIEFNFGNGVLTLPSSAAQTAGASSTEYKVLLLLAADPSAEPKELAVLADCDEAEVQAAIGFWRGAGVITVKNGKKPTQRKTADTTGERMPADSGDKPLVPARELPHYTTAELNALLEKRKDARLLIDECEKAVGKMFSPQEINTVLGLVDYMRLDSEYILELFAYCARIGKRSVRYIEKTAFELFDGDITEPGQLRDYIKRKDAAAEAEGKLRQMLGIGERSLTAKEKKYFEQWICEYRFSLDMIRKAYEITVDAGKVKIVDYMNGILEKWYADGVDTLEKVEKRNAEHTSSGKPRDGSFDTDDFFKAAVKRSLGDDFEP